MTAGAYDPVTGMIGGFFWEGKFWQVFFGVVNLSREFLGYSKQSEDSCSSRVSRPLSSSGNFRARKFGMGFLGVKFWSRDFLGFRLKP